LVLSGDGSDRRNSERADKEEKCNCKTQVASRLANLGRVAPDADNSEALPFTGIGLAVFFSGRYAKMAAFDFYQACP
jgi:hypothetical protein